MMFKLYRGVGASLEYREAWDSDDCIIEHWGTCGTRGEMRRHPFNDPSDKFDIYSNLLLSARTDGFEPILPDRHEGMLVQRAVDGHGTREDLERRHALEEWLNQKLGWLGLGHCDGGSIGSGSMEAFCPVVDYQIAMTALSTELCITFR